jgi:hypothetical protein
MALAVFAVAGLLADEHEAGFCGALAEDGLGRGAPEVTAATSGCGLAHGLQRPPLWQERGRVVRFLFERPYAVPSSSRRMAMTMGDAYRGRGADKRLAGGPAPAAAQLACDGAAMLDSPSTAWIPGLYANENSATRLRDQWTLQRLCEAFGVD